MMIQLLVAVSTFCNPMSIPNTPIGIECRDYPNGSALPESPAWRRAMWKADKTVQFRELADPTVLVEGNVWYLYPSCGLMWTSEDCGGTWKHVPVQAETSYAPGVVKFRGRYYMAMSHGCLSVADSPTGPFRELGKFDAGSFGDDPQMPTPAGDPTFLVDEGRLYLYWGVCNRPKSIWGAELDPENPLRAKTPARCLLEYDPKTYPWQSTNEGAWVFKRGGKYFLVYSGYGTSDPRYCGVAMKSDAPLGPFVHQKNNPFFSTTEGVVTGTGHGSVFEDEKGDLWVAYCIVVCRYHHFERLIGMDRVCMDENGDLSVSHATDTPQWLPSSGKRGATGWKALEAVCSAKEVCDGKLNTFHAFDACPVNIECAFGAPKTLRAYRLIWRDLGLDVRNGVNPGPYQYRIECRENGRWKTWYDASANGVDLTVDYREAPAVIADAVRLVIIGCPKGLTPAVSEFTVFGEDADHS